ncbi:hypothetical protein LR013_00295 [candidate division NPL-UPA2 bacterium]|nr:hypothetical protein [candidate division NPL-UPA2 bacterium]
MNRGGIIDVNIVAIDGHKFRPLQVELLSPALPVKIIGIDKSPLLPWEAIPVEVGY